MAGIYGTLGTNDEFDNVQEHFFFTGGEYSTKYKDSNRSIHAVFHNKKEAQSQPIEKNSVNLFIWGEICGYGDLNQYESRKNMGGKLTDAEYCAKLYEKFGGDFIEKLNSNFSGVILDQEESKIHLFTDRLGSRPIYYTKTSENSLIFSTSLQAVARHSNYEVEFKKEFLSQYLTIHRVLGTFTPLKDIKKLHPGSIITFDQKRGEIKEKIYWRPNYKPADKNFKFFVDRFLEIFDDVMKDRVDETKEHGLLLSGGTDSRLIAHYLKNQDIFHINKTMNREAKLAKKVTNITQNKFNFLKIDEEYLPRSLEKITPLMNFNNSFVQAHSIDFSESLSQMDYIWSGQYADNILLGLYIPTIKVKLPFPPYSELELLREIFPKKIDSLVDYLNYVQKDSLDHNLDYLNFDFKLVDSVLRDDRKFQINEISYKTVENLNHYGTNYPLTHAKATLEYECLNQISNTRYPFIDNRILEFSQYLPKKYKIRRDVVKKTLYRKNKDLSKLIHPKSLQPSYRSQMIHDSLRFFHLILDKVDNHMTGEGPWPDYYAMMKKTNYAEPIIRKNKEIFDAFDYLDYDLALKMVQSGTEKSIKYQIHSLLSFLKIYNSIVG